MNPLDSALRDLGFSAKSNSQGPNASAGVLVATQAYGPEGHDLVGFSDVKFDGYPAITLRVRTPEGREGLVHLSPIFGDRRVQGFPGLVPGTRCTLLCPVTRRPLDRLGASEDGSGANDFALYLTAQLARGPMMALSDLWGHAPARLVDDNAVISYWADA